MKKNGGGYAFDIIDINKDTSNKEIDWYLQRLNGILDNKKGTFDTLSKISEIEKMLENKITPDNREISITKFKEIEGTLTDFLKIYQPIIKSKYPEKKIEDIKYDEFESDTDDNILKKMDIGNALLGTIKNILEDNLPFCEFDIYNYDGNTRNRSVKLYRSSIPKIIEILNEFKNNRLLFTRMKILSSAKTELSNLFDVTIIKNTDGFEHMKDYFEDINDVNNNNTDRWQLLVYNISDYEIKNQNKPPSVYNNDIDKDTSVILNNIEKYFETTPPTHVVVLLTTKILNNLDM